MKTLICQYCGCSLVRLGISKEKAATYRYDGTEYHFCCQDCANEFAADPEQHLRRTKDLVVCPTCLAEKTPELTFTFEYAGQEVPYCGCPYCREVFLKAPDYYIKRLEGTEAMEGVGDFIRGGSDRDAITPISRGDGDFDLLIVGGGSAGFGAAIKGAELGARVAMAELGTLGGTCVNIGCVPSKTLIRAAEANHRRTHHPFEGIAATNGQPDWPVVRDHKDALVTGMRETKYRDVLRSYEAVTLFEQRATVTSGNSITLADGRQISAGKLVIATGASPWAAPIPGLAEAGYLDSTSAMALDTLPSSLIVIGASAVGLELAQMFLRLGVRVTLLEALPRIIPAEDPAIGSALAEYLGDEGMEIHAGVTIEAVERNGSYTVRFSQDDRASTATAEQLLVATGRHANTVGFGLDDVGVTLGKRGEVVVNEYLQTANPDIYAAGDVTGEPMFVYVAAYGGTTAAENALTGNARPFDLTALPKVTFTDPQVASVGFTEEEIRAQGAEPVTAELPLEHVPRALAARDTRGFVKLVADASTRKIVGAHILASEAGEMITELALAVQFGLTIENLTSTFHPYLTLSEGIKLAAQTFDKDVSKLSCCAG
ncbi:MAG: mercury(II) reductase [Gemmatimonadetes bacterium]|nr:mercury(II) reductase [Gemmatimonadota bacterium]